MARIRAENRQWLYPDLKELINKYYNYNNSAVAGLKPGCKRRRVG